jgi:hypothetical protein
MRLSLVLVLLASLAAAERPAYPLYETRAPLTPKSPLDTLVFDRLHRLNIEPAYLSSDSVFLRRVYLDVIGTLPTPQEASAFLQDPTPNKRALLIDALLDRPEFADYWAMKWSDLLRVKAEFPINLWPNAAQAYFHWIRAAIRENQPYDRFVRALLTTSGSNFRTPPVNFYRAMQSKEPAAIAQTVALTFMGARAEAWPRERLAGMAGFFSQLAYFFLPARLQGDRRMEGRDRLLQARPHAAASRLPRWHFRQTRPGPRSPRSLRRLADHAEESLVHAQHRQPCLELAPRPRHHQRAG